MATREELLAEAQRRGLLTNDAPQPSREDLVVEAQRRGLLQAEPKMDRPTAAGIGIADALTLNRTDDWGAPVISTVQNLQKGNFGEALDSANRAVSKVAGIFNPIAGNYARYVPADQYETAAQQNIQGLQKKAFEDRPGTYLAAQIGASAAMPAMAPAKGLGILGRLAVGGAEGGLYGAANASGVGDAQNPDLAKMGTGAALGTLGGTAGAAVAPLVGKALSKLGKRNPNQTNAFLGGLDNEPALPVETRTVRQSVRENVLKNAVRAGMTPENVSDFAKPWREMGRNPLVAQVAEPFKQRGQTLSSLPGQTPQLAANKIARIRDEQPGMLQDAIQSTFPKGSSYGRKQGLEAMLDAAHDDWAQTLGGPGVKQGALQMEYQGLRQTLQKAGQLDLVERELKTSTAHLGLDYDTMPIAEKMHWLKVQVGEMISNKETKGIDGLQRYAMTQTVNRLRRVLNSYVPGYEDVSAKHGDVMQAMEALDWSKGFFGKTRAEELQAQFAKMTPFQKQHALVSIAEELSTRLDRATSEGARRKNIAEPLLNRDLLNKLRAVMGTDADQFIKTLQIASKDFADTSALLPGTNSKTAPVFGDMMDQMASQPPRNIMDVVGTPLRMIYDSGRNALLESSRNKEGRVMYSEFTPEMEQALKDMLTKYYADRSLATRAAARGAASGGVAGGSFAGDR